MKFSLSVIYFIITIIIFSSCSITKNIPQKSSLVSKNKFYINDKRVYDVNEYKENILTNENNKLFSLYPFGVYIYQNIPKDIPKKFDTIVSNNPKKINFIESIFSKKSISKLKNKYTNAYRKIKDNFSEKPVLLNRTDYLKSAENLEEYFRAKGFLEAITFVKTETKNKKSTIYYNIYTGKRYSIDSIILNSNSPEIKNYTKILNLKIIVF